MTREEVLLRKIKLKRQLITLIYDEIQLLREEYESIGDVAEKWLQKEVVMKHTLIIKPAIPPAERHKIEKLLEKLGYEVFGSGTYTDMSFCDISFSKEVLK